MHRIAFLPGILLFSGILIMTILILKNTDLSRNIDRQMLYLRSIQNRIAELDSSEFTESRPFALMDYYIHLTDEIFFLNSGDTAGVNIYISAEGQKDNEGVEKYIRPSDEFMGLKALNVFIRSVSSNQNLSFHPVFNLLNPPGLLFPLLVNKIIWNKNGLEINATVIGL